MIKVFLESVIIIIICIESKVITKRILNPAIIFSVFWGLINILASCGFYGLIRPSNFVSIIVLFGIVFYDYGVIYSCVFKYRKPQETELNKIRLLILFVLAFIFVLKPAFNAIQLIRAGTSMWDIRYTKTTKVFSSGYAGYKFISLPFAATLPVLFVSSSLKQKKFNVKIFVLALTLGVACFIAEGGRTILFIWFISFLYYLTQLSQKVSFKMKRKLLIVLVLLLISVWYIFKLRDTQNIYKSIYTYFCGGLVSLSQSIKYIERDFKPTFFFSSYQGVIRPVIGILNKFGIDNPDLFNEATDFLLYCQTKPIVIFNNGEKINYFITNFGYYYADGSLIGVCLHSALFGIISGYSFNKKEINPNIKITGIYLFMIIGIGLGIMNSCFTEITFSWGLIYYYILFDKTKCNNCSNISLTTIVKGEL